MAPDSERMLAVILAIGTGVWAGGLLTVILLVVSSRKTVSAVDRVALFRRFGRLFAVAFGVTGVFVIFPALVLAVIEPGPLTATVLLLGCGLMLATVVGILQARRMTRMREAGRSGDVATKTLRFNAVIAAILRAALVLGYLALLVLAVILAGTL